MTKRVTGIGEIIKQIEWFVQLEETPQEARAVLQTSAAALRAAERHRAIADKLERGRHLRRWERVQELRALSKEEFHAAYEGKHTVTSIRAIVATEMGCSATVVEQSCKIVDRLHKEAERLYREATKP